MVQIVPDPESVSAAVKELHTQTYAHLKLIQK